MIEVTRPVLRWHGGKWLLAPWIISFFPKQHRVYVEPFGGGAGVLLRKPRSSTEIYNDLDSDAVNVFKVLRDRPDELARALALTPYAREEYLSLYEACDDPVERARRFISRSFMGMNSKGAMQRSGFDTRVNDDGFVSRLRSLTAVPEEVARVAGRLAGVIIEHDDGLAVARRHDREDALLYLDPPYVLETRSGSIFRHEMTDAEHHALLEGVRQLTGMVIISGYPHPLYDAVLVDWQRHERAARTDGSAGHATEVVWINPACAAALDRERAQRDMFEGAA